jgi:phage baseplate assembly protein W
MAIIQEQVQRKLYKGFSTVNNPFGNWRQTDLQALKQDLNNHFGIRKGEKLMNPDFGSNIKLMVMEQLDESTKQAIITDVNEVINNDPRLKASSVDLIEFEQGIQINIQMVYPEYDISNTINLTYTR